MAAKRIIPVPKRGTGTTGGGGVDEFLELIDVGPGSYIGFGGRAVVVNVGETGLEFSLVPFGAAQVTSFDVTTIPAVVVGQPVYAFSATDQVDLAQANAQATSRVVGFTYSATGALSLLPIVNAGFIELADWTLVTGTVSLVYGAQYFLDNVTAGKMITTAPVTSGHYVVPLGVALSATLFSINIGHPTRRA